MDPSRRRISGDGGGLSKQKSPVASDLAVSKDAMVSCFDGIRKKSLSLSLSVSACSSHPLVCTILPISLVIYNGL